MLHKKKFGQHFLSDPNILCRIAAFARIQPGDTVLEIGPGRGALTRELAAAAKKVIAVEIDADLIPVLRQTMPDNVEIIEGDALEVPFPEGPFHLVGNLPYNVATPLFKRFIELRASILDVTVMIQKEVADRIRAKPNDEAYGPLSVLMQYYAIPEKGFTVPPGAFTPKPKVDSAMIRLTWRPDVPYDKEFTDFVHHAFGSRRKKLINNMLPLFQQSRGDLLAAIAESGIREDARPENLSVEDFHRLYNRIRRN